MSNKTKRKGIGFSDTFNFSVWVSITEPAADPVPAGSAEHSAD